MRRKVKTSSHKFFGSDLKLFGAECEILYKILWGKSSWTIPAARFTFLNLFFNVSPWNWTEIEHNLDGKQFSFSSSIVFSVFLTSLQQTTKCNKNNCKCFFHTKQKKKSAIRSSALKLYVCELWLPGILYITTKCCAIHKQKRIKPSAFHFWSNRQNCRGNDQMRFRLRLSEVRFECSLAFLNGLAFRVIIICNTDRKQFTKCQGLWNSKSKHE